MTFTKIAAAIAAALAVVFALAVPAQAAPVGAPLCQVTKTCEKGGGTLAAPPANCRYNYSACGYESAFYNCDDGCEVIPRQTPGCEPVALAGQWSSYFNNSGRTTRVYKTTGCTGSYLTYYSGTGETYFLTSGHTDWENAVRSVRFV